jgi:hypothetical protein
MFMPRYPHIPTPESTGRDVSTGVMNLMFSSEWKRPAAQGVGSVKTKLIDRLRAMEIEANKKWKREE